ncbi:MAG: fatty acid desaturase CarF family protein [Pseudomonadota bacterium]|nr:fatty acid desaturase CarF family protein [Pseudomonadota bacterium]
MWVIYLIGIVVLADFLSGLVHWWEDAYAHPDMPFMQHVAHNNLMHHHKPRDFLRKSWWQSSADLLAIGAVILLLAWWGGWLNIWVVLFVVIAVNANQIHKWAHQNRQEKPWLVSKLQDWRILQTPREHARHHSGEKNSHYCAITNVLNPILERLHFWVGLETIIAKTTGIQRRKDGDYLAILQAKSKS